MTRRAAQSLALVLSALPLAGCGTGPGGQDPYPGQPLGMSPTALWFLILFLAGLAAIVAVVALVNRR